MKSIIIVLLVSALVAIGATTAVYQAVQTQTNGVLYLPSNFFTTNLIPRLNTTNVYATTNYFPAGGLFMGGVLVGTGSGGGCDLLWTNYNNTVFPSGASGVSCSWISANNIMYPQ